MLCCSRLLIGLRSAIFISPLPCSTCPLFTCITAHYHLLLLWLLWLWLLLLLLMLLLLLFMLLSFIFLLDRYSESKLRLAALGLQNSSKQSCSSEQSCLLWQWYLFVVILILTRWLGKFLDTIPSVPITTGTTIVLTFRSRSSSLL